MTAEVLVIALTVKRTSDLKSSWNRGPRALISIVLQDSGFTSFPRYYKLMGPVTVQAYYVSRESIISGPAFSY